MSDVLTPTQRSFNMSRIKSQNTKPEKIIRQLLWSNGIRGYRLKRKIPGKPDLYFPRKDVAVFIDGCFWHKCSECYIKPRTNSEFWNKKINGNVSRDNKVNEQLKLLNIRTIRIWEHEVRRSPQSCILKIMELLSA